jgi:phosphate starvation-inducible PhoH-like protein
MAVQEILTGIDDVAFCTLTSADVVRHRLVGEIVDAYGRYDATVGLRPAAPHRGPRRA